MPHYRLFGLHVRSDRAIPGLSPFPAGDPDVRLAEASRRPDVDMGPGMRRYTEEGGRARVAWRGVASADVRGGTEISLFREPEADPRDVTLMILGPVMAALLRQRGYFVLHASCMALHDCAIAFCGFSGWGKSTSAAGLLHAGWRFVTDDVLAIDVRSGEVRVTPSFPTMRIHPSTLESWGVDASGLLVVGARSDKVGWPIAERFEEGSARLEHILLLTDPRSLHSVAAPSVERLNNLESTANLAAHTFGVSGIGGTGRGSHLAEAARIASLVPMSRLSVPREPESLAWIAHGLEALLTDVVSHGLVA